MTPLRTIIIDDVKLIRDELKTLLLEYPEIEVIGEAGTLDQAIELITTYKPDVIFLDVQLKEETGFTLLEKINVDLKIIFITAYDQYAIRAFEVNALDYLLKPIDKERLDKAIARLKSGGQDAVVRKGGRLDYDDVIYLMINGSFKFIKIKAIRCLIAAGKYSYLYYGERKNKDLVSKTLLEWEKILPEQYLVRIHRSTIVNFEHVERVKKQKNNCHEVYIRGIETPFIISRRYASRLKKFLVR
ncbi:MAG TPA: response regulator transcription factor [Caldithrix abyssi]|uniref:Response regulator transcription factor n=1 Tax=Caldithrix abyssi TaxID=187145 RepID=A0A7V5VFP1_CALAY|nr:response regulator transcription factor [Caldithrix abyssi]